MVPLPSRTGKDTWADPGDFIEQAPATAFDRSGKLLLRAYRATPTQGS